MPFQFVEHAVSDYACHNTLEGITKNEIQLSHTHFFNDSRHRITYDIWSGLVATMPLCEEDRRARPQVTPRDSFRSDKSLLWSAAHTKVYALHSIQLLEPYVDHLDNIWLSWRAHCEMLHRMFATGFTAQTLRELHDSVLNHYRLFTAAHASGEVPKNMWNLHMAIDVFRNGTPQHNSCIRMETGHRYFKRLHNSCSVNMKSRIATMAKRYCRHKAYNQHQTREGGASARPDLVVSLGRPQVIEVDLTAESDLPDLLTDNDAVQAHLARGGDTLTVCYHPRVEYMGHEIRTGRGISLMGDDGARVIGRVVALVELPQLGSFHVIYNEYLSGLVAGDCVVTNSISASDRIVQFHTHDLTFLSSLFDREETGMTAIVF